MNLNIVTETFLDFPDEESIAVMAFLEGCEHGCPNCQNKDLQIRNPQHETTWQNVLATIEERCFRNETDKVVLTGGDPYFEADHNREAMYLIDALENLDYSVCVYTGYTIEHINDLYESIGECLKKPSYLKCGRYMENLRDSRMGKTSDSFILASTNQRFYKRNSNNTFKQISKENVLEF